MDDFPGNSRSQRSPEVEPDKKAEKLEKVVTGKVMRRQKPLGRRFVETFFSGANNVWAYVLHEILIPAAKDTISDVVSQGVERMVYGEGRSASRRTGQRPGHSPNYVNYSRYSRGGAREEPRTLSRRARSAHDFQEIILATRAEAEDVLDGLFSAISKYDQVTVSDLYDLLGIPSNFTDERYGWRDGDLRGAGPTRVQGGYLLDLPKPDLLN